VRETLRPALRAATIAAVSVGTLLFVLNPPSLSGAGDLLTAAVAALALILGTAWATVALTGRDSMSDQEFERLVRRSEALAGDPGLAAEMSEFDLLVSDAIDRLPEEFQELLETTPVVVSSRGRELGAYGRYYGDTVARENYPDRIVLYQDTLERDFGHDPDLLTAQVERTLRHELAHHLGWNERGVRELGL
jgi:predicted Zn-dependent protease with MMP-like domain